MMGIAGAGQPFEFEPNGQRSSRLGSSKETSILTIIARYFAIPTAYDADVSRTARNIRSRRFAMDLVSIVTCRRRPLVHETHVFHDESWIRQRFHDPMVKGRSTRPYSHPGCATSVSVKAIRYAQITHILLRLTPKSQMSTAVLEATGVDGHGVMAEERRNRQRETLLSGAEYSR